MKYLGKVQEAKDLVNVQYVSEVDSQIRGDLSPLIEDATEVIISGTEPTGKNRRAIWVDTNSSGGGSVPSTANDEVQISATRPDSFKLWIDTDEAQVEGVISVNEGGTNATNADAARVNLRATPYINISNIIKQGSITATGYLNYVAAQDSFVILNLALQANSNGGYTLTINDIPLIQETVGAMPLNHIPICFPLAKGDKFKIQMNSNNASKYYILAMK